MPMNNEARNTALSIVQQIVTAPGESNVGRQAIEIGIAKLKNEHNISRMEALNLFREFVNSNRNVIQKLAVAVEELSEELSQNRPK